MDGMKMILTRRSIRHYQSRPIPDSLIDKIIYAGQQAASARNQQPWEFIVIRERVLKQKLADLTDHGKFIGEAPCCIALFCEDSKYYLEDGAAAAQNILLAARYFGIGSCWVAGDKKPYGDKAREYCGAKPNAKLIALIALGYPEKETAFTEREIKEPAFKKID